MEEILKQILSKLDNLEKGQERLEKKVDGIDKKADDLKSSIIHNLSPYFENITQHIDDSEEKTKRYVDDKTEALNKRVFATETDIQRLAKQ